MNKLELVNRLRMECGVSGNDLVSLTGVTGESLRMVSWINSAYEDVQRRHQDWEWLRTTVTFPTVDAQQVYTLSNIGISSAFSKWKPETFRLYVTSSGYSTETFLSYQDYETFRDTWQYNANRTITGRPTVFAVTPNKSIALGMTPDATGYTIIGDYYQAPGTLANDTSEPLFPARYHMLLVYMAMQSYAGYEAAPEVMQRGVQKASELVAQLEADQLPMITSGTLV